MGGEGKRDRERGRETKTERSERRGKFAFLVLSRDMPDPGR